MKLPWYIDPAPHEFGAHLLFTAHDLTPFFALNSTVQRVGGSTTTSLQYDGEVWDVRFGCSESGLKPRDHPDFDIETVREFTLHVRERAAPEERKAHFHIAPRWPMMESKDDSPTPSVPDGILGVNVTTQGSNLPMGAYPNLLRRAVTALDLNPQYFETIHPYSCVFAYEVYTRLNRDVSEALIGRNSPLRRIFEHVADKSGFRELREDDNGVRGYHHRVIIDSDGAAALIPEHELAKRLKHYHPQHPRADPDDPLYHPKFGVSFVKKQNDEGAVPWDDRARLHRELEEQLVNTLLWAGLPARQASDVFVADAYFEVTESARNLRVVDDPTPEIRRKQDAVVIESVTANPDLNQSDLDVLDVVTAGSRSIDALVADTGWCKRTIYRVLDRLKGLVTNQNGRVAFASDYLGDVVRTVLSDAKEGSPHDRESGQEDSPWAQFVNAYSIKVEDPPDARLTLRFGLRPDNVQKAIRDGFRAWCEAGRDPCRYKTGRAVWTDAEGTTHWRVRLLR